MYKTLKGQSEAVIPRKADNTIEKNTNGAIRTRKSKKGRKYNRKMYKILKTQSEAVNPRKADNTIEQCTGY